MKLPGALKTELIDFLKSLPNLDDVKSRRAFIYSAGIDSQIEEQIQFDEAPAQFIPLLVSKLLDYGQLEDGRCALEVVLVAAKDYVGWDKKEYCDKLIRRLQESLQETEGIKYNFSYHFIPKKKKISKIPIAILLVFLGIVIFFSFYNSFFFQEAPIFAIKESYLRPESSVHIVA